MRFKDLEEGKKYRSCNLALNDTIFRKFDGLLQELIDCKWEYSDKSMFIVRGINFKPYVEYHTLEEAVEWMKEGGMCQHGVEKIKLDNTNPLQFMYEDYGDWSCCEFFLCYLDPKWVLLDKEEE